MKQSFVIILALIGFLSFAQENKTSEIDKLVESIKVDSTLIKSEFDWVELTGITTDGGGILKVWWNRNQIVRVYEEIGLSYGRISTSIYLQNGTPIKIIEIEENFNQTNPSVNYDKINEVFRAEIYVFDWEKDNSKVERTGERNMSEGNCSTFDYEPIIERAKNAVNFQSMSKKELLLGKWFFHRAIDESGKEIKLNDINGQYEIGMIEPDIEFFNNKSYQKILRIDPKNIQTGKWKLIKDEVIEFTFTNDKNRELNIKLNLHKLTLTDMILKKDQDTYYVYKRNSE